MKFGIEEKHFQILQKTIIQPLKSQGAQVWIFGSRATGLFKPFSDVDLLFEIQPNSTLPTGMLFLIKDELDESNFPYKVDLVERSKVAASYKEQIEKEKILL